MVAKETCPDPSQLNGMLDGTLLPDDQTKVSLHLEECKECQAKFEDLARGAGVLPDGTLTENRQESALLRVMEKLASEGPETAERGKAYDDASRGEGPYLPFLTPSDSADYLGRLGPYNVVSVIGQGGMGIVLKAHDPRLNRFVAIKVLAPQLAAYAGARQRFMREAQAAAALTHDHIVTIHAVDEFNGFPYIVMQYVVGASLAEEIGRGGPLALNEIVRIGSQIASGLAAAHAQGLVHRDIKPANILLEADGGRVKITDFGLARAVGDAQITQTGQITGTPEFMSPEQARGEWLDHRSDLFSLGCVLYAMGSGQSPFRSKTAWDAIGRVCNEQPCPLKELNPEIPDWLETIVERLLAKKPEDRPQTALEVAEQLANSVPLLRRSSAGPGSLAGSACQQAVARFNEECGLAEQPETAACQTSPSPPATHRWKPRTVAAVALLALFCSFAVFQIIIHIKREGDKAGTETTIRVDNGAHVAVHNDGNVEVQLSPNEAMSSPAAVDLSKMSDAEIQAAIQKGVDDAFGDDGPYAKEVGRKVLKKFAVTDRLLPTDGVTVDQDAWQVETKAGRTVWLFDIQNPDAINCWLIFSADLKIEKLDGQARLEMLCHMQDGNLYRANALEAPDVSGTSEWAPYTSAFKMRRGDRPRSIELGVSVEGHGTLGIRNPKVVKQLLRNEGVSLGPAEKIRSFDSLAEPSTSEGVIKEQDAWRIETKGDREVRIFDISMPRALDEPIEYHVFCRAKLKTENLTGRAYLAIGTLDADGKDWFSECYYQPGVGRPTGPVTGTTDWATYESSDHPMQGTYPAHERWKTIKLNLVIEGQGTVWIKDIALLKAPVRPPEPEIRVEPVVAGHPGAVSNKASSVPLIASFETGVATISKDGVTVDENAWRIEATKNRTVRLFEIADPGVEDCTILYRAKMKCESLDGKAYLEMWCRSSTGGEAFSKGLDNTVTGATDWASYEIPFFLKRGEACDLIKLNAVIEGKGTLWIKDVELLKGPLPSGIQTSAASQPEVEIESDSASNHGDVAAQSQTDKEQWARELAGLQEGNWRGAFQVGQQLAKLPPEDGFAILKENWEEIGAVDARQQMLKAWSFSQNHPRILDVLDLGMNDPSPEVQGWAQNYLRSLAFKDFAEDFPAYKAWYAAAQGKPLADVVAESVREFVADAAKADGQSPLKRVELMNTYCGRIFQDMPEVRAAAIDAGLVQVLERWIAIGVEPKTSRENVKLAAQAMRAIAPLKLDEEELRRVVMPRLTRQTPGEVRAAAAEALKRKEFPWAADLLVDVLKDGLYTEDLSSRAVIWAAATALAEIGDPKTIPPMIAVIEADNTYDTVYGVGYFGLGRLTGVTYDESHNGAWWRQWWEKNRERYPTDIREIPIPNLPKRATPPSNRVKTDDPQADVADIAAVDLQAGGDPKKRYFLNMKSGDQAPPQGFGLLIVLPGGDGSEDFQPFVRRIHKNVLGKGWLIAQAVAPKWDGKQSDQVVWPTDGLKYPAAKFTTEEFVEAIVADVQTKLERQKVDPKRIFVLGWSSGGAAAYAAALRKGSPLTGAFVAMSVFKPEQLPAIENAKGKSFYLLQSPDDALIPMRFADTAAKTLQEAGANVHLQHYAGGHGWHGDVWKLIGDGISWLDQRATIATDGKPE